MKNNGKGRGRWLPGVIFFFLGCWAWVAAAMAAEADFATWLAAFETEAKGAGISAATLDSALAGVTPLPRVLELDRQQPDFTKGLEEYLQLAVSERQAKKGWFKLQGNSPLLRDIGRRHGVPAALLVALWGLESNYGLLQGDFPVFPALATLAHDPRRSEYFRGELLAALHLLEEGKLARAKMQGSWAGAMGGLQLMPSVVRECAVDEDGDGAFDIWRSLPDLFATGANFLKKSGWKNGQGWGLEVRLPATFDRALVGKENRRPLSQWLRAGAAPVKKDAVAGPDLQAVLLIPEEKGERAFLLFDNYEVLLQWNRSHNFALAVGLLADQISSM